MKRCGVLAIVGACILGATLLALLKVGCWLAAPVTIPKQADIVVALGG